MFRDYIRSLKQAKDPLPPRYNVMKFGVQTNTKELDKNIKLQGLPGDLKDKVKEMVIDYWGVFGEDGLSQPIQGFSFHIDTVNYPSIFCKPPRYGPHESKVLKNMVESLDENVVVEEDNRTWISLLVLAKNPHKENVP